MKDTSIELNDKLGIKKALLKKTEKHLELNKQSLKESQKEGIQLKELLFLANKAAQEADERAEYSVS